MLLVYLHAIDHVFGQNDGWKRLQTLVKELSAAFALAVPRPETEQIAPHLAFFQQVVAMIFLRSFRWGYVRQLDRVSRQLLARAWAAGAGPGDSPLTIDLASTTR